MVVIEFARRTKLVISFIELDIFTFCGCFNIISLNNVCVYAFVVSVRIQKLELKNVKTSSDLKELEDLKAESRRIKLVTTNIILILLYPKKLCYLLQNNTVYRLTAHLILKF